MATSAPLHPDYPTASAVDAWCAGIRAEADAAALTAVETDERGFSERLGLYHTRARFVRFQSPTLGEFCGYWQLAAAQPAPLVVHLPGYGHEVCAQPELTAAGWNVLDLVPMGYLSPEAGWDAARRGEGGHWPVMAETIRSYGRSGYRQWFAQACAAVRWARSLPITAPGRVSFIGTSQGGGAALLLASLHRGDGVRCVAADVPFLTDYPRTVELSTFPLIAGPLATVPDRAAAWHALGLIDTCAHAHRLDLPVMLIAAAKDTVCPPATITALYARLPGTRSLTVVEDLGHCHTLPGLHLTMAWLRLHA